MSSNSAWNAEYNSLKGSLLVGNGTRPIVRTIGADGQVLTANSAQADGVEWQTGVTVENLTAWTPVIAGSGAAGVGTYTNQGGWYTRVGPMVFAQFYLEWSAHTGTGNMLITGLPYIPNNSTLYLPTFALLTGNLTYPVSTTSVFGTMLPGSPNVAVSACGSGVAFPVDLPMSGTGLLVGEFIYST